VEVSALAYDGLLLMVRNKTNFVNVNFMNIM